MHPQLKSVLGRALYQTGAHERFWQDRALIAAFHTIREVDTPIACSRAKFADYCDFFRDHFHVVALSELLARLAAGRDISRHLVITFDDGYRDNHQVAMDVLERRGLPACFFVVSDFIGTQRQAWWDWELGVRSEWMTWDDVRRLKAHGFEVGSHTASHPDLGSVGPDVAEADIRASMQRLEQELGTRPTLFAYPYGRRENMCEDNLEAVKRCGLSCCLSSYGGIVEPGADPFRLQRIGISPWFRTPYHLGFEAASLAWLGGQSPGHSAGRPRHQAAFDPAGRNQQLIQPEGLLYR